MIIINPTHEIMSLVLLLVFSFIIILATAMTVYFLVKGPSDRMSMIIVLWVVTLLVGVVIFSLPCTGYQMIRFGNIAIPPDICAMIQRR